MSDEGPIVIAEDPVPQVDDDYDYADTEVEVIEPLSAIDVMPTSRAVTSSDWPPAPLPPAVPEDALAAGTERRARFFVAVRRPTTSSDTGDT